MNCFDLPSVNEYLSEWEDEDSYEKNKIFDKCHESLKIIDKLNFALAICIHATDKQKDLWREGIQNVFNTITRKLDYLSFMLLKDAERYMNPKTENMEYGVKDSEGNGIITLCLWANLYMSVRKQGMSKLGFKFRLPKDIVEENCAIRIMHTAFNYIVPVRVSTDEEIPDDEVQLDAGATETEMAVKESDDTEKSTEDQSEVPPSQDEEITPIEKESTDENVDLAEKFPSAEREEQLLLPEENEAHIPEDEDLENEQELKEFDFTAFNPKILPPLTEPAMQFVDPNEYFVVGGIFHFDLYLVPSLNVRKENYTYICKEKPKLRRIIYKRKIVPPRTLDGGTPYIVKAYERLRFRKELKNAIFVQLQLPKQVMYLSNPEPARFFPEKGGYSKDCVFDVEYSIAEESRQISFKTNQFGLFGMLQRKYQNLPYKECTTIRGGDSVEISLKGSVIDIDTEIKDIAYKVLYLHPHFTKWFVKGGDSVVMSLKGQVVDIDIEVTDRGYKVLSFYPDDDSICSELRQSWMVADLMIEKLRTVGINIELMEDTEKFADIHKVVTSLEFKVYDCMALLCRCCSFLSAKSITSSKEEIVLYYSLKEDESKKIIIRNTGVSDYEEEMAKIAAKNIANEVNDDFNAEEVVTEDLKNSKKSNTDLGIEKESVETEEIKEGVLTQEVDGQSIFNDLYHYVMNGVDEKLKKEILSTNPSLIQNVRSLLKYCRPISSLRQIEKEENI